MPPAPSSDRQNKVRRGGGVESSHSAIRQARFLCSIDERRCDAGQVSDFASCGSANSSTESLNFSRLFDDIGTANCSTINIRNSSLTGYSAINSTFFASDDQMPPRPLGDTTVSNFGNSRHAMRLYEPIPPTWPAYPADTGSSVDTLPMYAPRSEPPPPYFRVPQAPMSSPPPAERNWRRTVSDTYEPSGSHGFHRIHGPQPVRAAAPGTANGRSLVSSSDNMRQRHYPRRMW